MTGHDTQYILDKMPEAIGLQYESLWWERENTRRQLSALSAMSEKGLPQIAVLAAHEGGGKEEFLV